MCYLQMWLLHLHEMAVEEGPSATIQQECLEPPVIAGQQ